MMDIKEQILKKFKRNKGFLCSEQIDDSVQRYYISKMLNAGEIQRVKNGIYILESGASYDERVLLSKMYPQSVFCLFSAWEYHELSTSIASRYYLALSRNTKVREIKYLPLQLHYWSENSFELGMIEVKIDGNKIKIYDIEKSVCDAVKHRTKVGEDITLEVIKNYILSENRNLDKLMKYAKILKTENIMQQYVKPLL